MLPFGTAGNATIVTVATEQLIYAKRKGNAMSDDDMKAELERLRSETPRLRRELPTASG
jgi:hypothetical protein